MIYWKPLSKYRYSRERNEFKYHTDFQLDEGEEIEVKLAGKTIIKDEVPQGKEWRYHLEIACESFPPKGQTKNKN